MYIYIYVCACVRTCICIYILYISVFYFHKTFSAFHCDLHLAFWIPSLEVRHAQRQAFWHTKMHMNPHQAGGLFPRPPNNRKMLSSFLK